MTTCEPLPAQGSLPMGLAPLMLSPGGFPAKMFQQPVILLGSPMAPAAAYGLRSSVLLAKFDHPTSSWRTSQTCLLALASGLGDGLAEFSETWPASGMMRNGRTYRRRPWALPIAANASGLLPTPCKIEIEEQPEKWLARSAIHASKGQHLHFKLNVAAKMWPIPVKSMSKGSSPNSLMRKDGRDRSKDRLDHSIMALHGGQLNPAWVEWLMGFPTGHTALPPSETP